MALAHPFQPVTHRQHRTHRALRRRSSPGPVVTSHEVTPTAAPADVPERTSRGIPRELVLDDAGAPRRSVLLAAIMIRRGRTVPEISAATGLPADVVTALSRTV